jgi:hypothetical protein
MKHILLVDDSATMRRMVMASLRTLKDVSFQEASNGLEAIERISPNVKNISPLSAAIYSLSNPLYNSRKLSQPCWRNSSGVFTRLKACRAWWG